MTTNRGKPPERSDILKYWTLSSGIRILAAANGFRNAFGFWPTRILLNRSMAEAIKDHILTPVGWAMLTSKFALVPIDEGKVIAEGENGARYEYCCDPCEHLSVDGTYPDEWIWGLRLTE